jgi:hypothetical protein
MTPARKATGDEASDTNDAERRSKVVKAANTRYSQAVAKIDALGRLSRYKTAFTADDAEKIIAGLTARVDDLARKFKGEAPSLIEE